MYSSKDTRWDSRAQDDGICGGSREVFGGKMMEYVVEAERSLEEGWSDNEE
jgi:hypothetical protein